MEAKSILDVECYSKKEHDKEIRRHRKQEKRELAQQKSREQKKKQKIRMAIREVKILTRVLEGKYTKRQIMRRIEQIEENHPDIFNSWD